MRKLENRIILWPSYFDIQGTKKDGRHVPRRLCVELPKIEELAQAANEFRPDIVQEVRYPRQWWLRSGYLIVDKLVSKEATLDQIGQKLVELRRSSLGKVKK